MSDRQPLILVIEDDPSIQNLLGLLLSGEGYEVMPARDGLEGLVKLDREHVALVILDLMMPNIGGDRVFTEITGDPRMKDVPVLVVSGRHDVHEIYDDKIGRENVFAKPLDPADLLTRIAEILGTGS